GLHVGPVTAGVLGKERLQYDIWGDTVNVASRMEGSSEPNRIHVSENFAQALQEVTAMRVRHNGVSEQTELPHGQPGTRSIRVELRGETELKGKGMVKTFWLTSE
ncbi:MAG: adenylate/guanylate cyclase domain-containing protein, partial [Ignavibacteria bacterium]|nr:adenylate/guanylate cyclase domain-containing protein [Ignavibacteria bacterium]